MTTRITWFFRERSQLRKMRKLGIEDQDPQLLWAHDLRERGINQQVPDGCIVGRAAAATAMGTKNDVVARVYPGENGRWIMLESD